MDGFWLVHISRLRGHIESSGMNELRAIAKGLINAQIQTLLVNCSHAGAEAIAAAGEINELMIIGGSHIYTLFLPIANRFYLTRVDGEFDGDTIFPAFDLADWHESFHQHHPVDEKHAYPFDFYILERR